jgi:hypothetical protein
MTAVGRSGDRWHSGRRIVPETPNLQDLDAERLESGEKSLQFCLIR